MTGLLERLKPRPAESRFDAFLTSVHRLRWAWLLLAANLAIFGFHLLPALEENAQVERVRRRLARDVRQLESETRMLADESRALQTDPYFLQIEARRRRHAPSIQNVIVVVDGES